MVRIKAGNEIIEGIELVSFDKDGTLIDLYAYWGTMVGFRADEICRMLDIDPRENKEGLMNAMGVDTKNERLFPEGPVGLLPRRMVQKSAENYLNERIYSESIEEVCFNAFKKVDEFSLEGLDELIRPINGALHLLKELKNNGIKIAIATTDKTERAEVAMKFLGIRDLINIIVGSDMVEKSKPSPEMVEVICRELKVNPRNSIMVGDAITDVQMGKNALCRKSIGVLTGLTREDDLKEVADIIVNDVGEITVVGN